MKLWLRITLLLVVLLPVSVLGVYFLTDGSLVWAFASGGLLLAAFAVEFMAQSERGESLRSGRFGFLFWQIKTMREASIVAACLYPPAVLLLHLLGSSWISAIVIPTGAIAGLLIGQRMVLGKKAAEECSNESTSREPGWHPHPDQPEWWFYWDGKEWSGDPQRR